MEELGIKIDNKKEKQPVKKQQLTGDLSQPLSDFEGKVGVAASRSPKDLYSLLKTIQRELEFMSIQEEYIKDEQKNLKRELLRAKEEVKRIQSVPLIIGQFLEMVS